MPTMRMMKLFALLVLLTTPCLSQASTIRATRTASNEECLYCYINQMYVAFESKPDAEFFECTTKSEQERDAFAGMTYAVELPSDFVSENKQQLISGNALICIPGGQPVRATTDLEIHSHIRIPTGSKISMVEDDDGGRRRLQQSKMMGTRSLLVVRITTPFQPNDVTRDALAGSIFGLGDEPLSNNVVAQYQRCSMNQLNIVPASSSDGRIVNGVVNINLHFSLFGRSIVDTENWLTQAVQVQLGIANLEETFDHVLYCLPEGTKYYDDSAWIGFAQFNGYKFYAHNNWCVRLTLVQHEFGHTLGFRHSIKNPADEPNFFNEWDFTDIMSVSTQQQNGPLYCFNGQKNWMTGWFNQKVRDLSRIPVIGDGWSGHLFSSLDYDLADAGKDQYVLLKVDNMFVQFNRARDYNMGVLEHADRVTIVVGTGPAMDEESILLTGLGPGERFTQDGFTFEVCSIVTGSMPEYATLSVKKDGPGTACETLRTQRLPALNPTPTVPEDDRPDDHWTSGLAPQSTIPPDQDNVWTQPLDSRCGKSELDARAHCKPVCENSNDCPVAGEFCFGVFDNFCHRVRPLLNCTDADNSATVMSRCGVYEFSARELCGAPCDVHADCGFLPCWPVMPNFCECKK